MWSVRKGSNAVIPVNELVQVTCETLRRNQVPQILVDILWCNKSHIPPRNNSRHIFSVMSFVLTRSLLLVRSVSDFFRCSDPLGTWPSFSPWIEPMLSSIRKKRWNIFFLQYCSVITRQEKRTANIYKTHKAKLPGD